ISASAPTRPIAQEIVGSPAGIPANLDSSDAAYVSARLLPASYQGSGLGPDEASRTRTIRLGLPPPCVLPGLGSRPGRGVRDANRRSLGAAGTTAVAPGRPL